MVRTSALTLAILFIIAAILLLGLLTNWFRYSLSLEAIFVIAAVCIAVVLVIWLSYVTYARNSGGFLGATAAVAIVSAAIVLLVHDNTIGGMPHLALSHVEKSPPAVLQAQRGDIKYWLEIENPFSSQHAEFLVLDDGKERRIPIQLFVEPSKGYTSAAKSSDWGVLSLTSDSNVLVLTVGPFLSSSSKKFRVDLTISRATEVPNT